MDGAGYTGLIGGRDLGDRKLPATGPADVARAVTAAWGTPPIGDPRPVLLWGRALALDDLERPPARPAVPGRSRPARS